MRVLSSFMFQGLLLLSSIWEDWKRLVNQSESKSDASSICLWAGVVNPEYCLALVSTWVPDIKVGST